MSAEDLSLTPGMNGRDLAAKLRERVEKLSAQLEEALLELHEVEPIFDTNDESPEDEPFPFGIESISDSPLLIATSGGTLEVELEQVQELLDEGTVLTADTLVMARGMQQWSPFRRKSASCDEKSRCVAVFLDL
eukprot:SAG31_NODE_70_length_28117_cov_100.521843_28_plen_134_part_00